MEGDRDTRGRRHGRLSGQPIRPDTAPPSRQGAAARRGRNLEARCEREITERTRRRAADISRLFVTHSGHAAGANAAAADDGAAMAWPPTP
jgi:hypothetical protein